MENFHFILLKHKILNLYFQLDLEVELKYKCSVFFIGIFSTGSMTLDKTLQSTYIEFIKKRSYINSISICR